METKTCRVQVSDKEMAPRVVQHPEARPTANQLAEVRTVDSTKDSAPAHQPTIAKKLAQLEDKYRHELLSEEERQEVRDRVIRLRRKLGL
jgi:hypothetical protein